MRYMLFILLILISSKGLSQIETNVIEPGKIPKDLVYKGEYIKSLKWVDSLGENYLIISQSKITKSKSALESNEGDVNADNTDKEIYAIQYVISDSIKVLWKLLDFERECPFDLTVEYLTKIPIITDLDNNGTYETWLVYWLGCRSDVSPLNMKLIMHIGKEKYAIRGDRMIRYGAGPNEIAGGKIKIDDNLKQLPNIFYDYALSLWEKFKTESN